MLLILWEDDFMDKRLKKMLIKSITALAGIIAFVVLLCGLFFSVTQKALPIVCIFIPIACVFAFRIIIHTALQAYLYITYDGSDTKDEKEIKATSLISKLDLASKIITAGLTGLVLILAFVGILASPAVSKDVNTSEFIEIAVENVDVKSEKYFSNCITDYYSYGEKCNNYTTTLFVEKITDCPKWFVKYHYNESYFMLDKNIQLGETLTVTDADNDRYSCAYVLNENGTRIGIIAMNDNNFIECTVSVPSDSGISVNTDKVLKYIDNFF